LTHPDLTRIPIQWAEREIVGSKEEIENRLSAGIKTFAYPYGRYNSKIREIVRNHFEEACCSAKLGKLEMDCDPHDLKRIDMYYLRSEKLFRIIPTHTLDWYLQFRQVFRELKQVCI
jgi:Predicted xylanase/chitin deacetylase